MTQPDLPNLASPPVWVGWLRSLDRPGLRWKDVVAARSWDECWGRLLDYRKQVDFEALEAVVLPAGITPWEEDEPAAKAAPVPLSEAARAFLEMTGGKVMPRTWIKKPAISEKQFMAQVIQLAGVCGWFVYHTYDSRRSNEGFPDLVLVHPGRRLVLYRELKTDTGKLSPDQQLWLDRLASAGQDAKTWRPKDWPEIEATLTKI